MIRHLVSLSILCSVTAFGQHNEHHTALGSHEHGSVKMSMAIDGKKVEIDLEGPSESFLGFEHKAKSKSDLQALQRAKELWNAEILTKIVMLDSKLDCKIDSTSFEQTQPAGEHSEIEASAQFTCAMDLKGSDMKIGLKDKFPKIKKLKLEIIGAQSKVLDIKKAIEHVKL